MIRVPNQRCIRNLSKKSLKASGSRNLIAIAAIALTTMLFTALFTIGMTLVASYEQQTMRQVGGKMHGTFKSVTEEQIQELADDPLIVEWGSRLMLGMPSNPPFNKAHVEVSYMDPIQAEGYFCVPEVGTLPAENTDEIACDTRILSLLGVTPEVGAKVPLSYYLGSNTTNPVLVQDTFTLSGWWTYDPASMASHAVVPRSYAEKVLTGYERVGEYDMTGAWNMDIYFANSRHIADDLATVLQNHGYQDQDRNQPGYISTGINWAYTGAQFAANADPMTLILIGVLLAVIAFTGYLIIYNIFQISVTHDIQFYGLLKTIGTTGKQIKTIVRRQALSLSLIGIPLGLLFGYVIGTQLSPLIISHLSGMSFTTTLHPVIFVGSTLFSLCTVLISCHRPGSMAARVSPIEALRYTEGAQGKRKRKRVKRGRGGANTKRMAFANLGRSRLKTTLVVLSLSLSVVLMQITYSFTNGFDMDKYLRTWVVTDFILGGADYFQTSGFFSRDTAVPEDAIQAVQDAAKTATGTGITGQGRIYGQTSSVKEFVSEEWFRTSRNFFADDEMLDMMLETRERTPDGRVVDDVNLYGMEDLLLDQLNVIDGDLAPLYDPTQNAIAAVYLTDDYDAVHNDSMWAQVGDTITLRYVDEMAYYDTRTGEEMPVDTIEPGYVGSRPKKYRDIEYTVAACVTMRHSMSYRYYGSDQFVLNSEVFQRDSGTSDVMTYLFNTTPEATDSIEAFLADYTENIDPLLDYESKKSYTDEFNGFRSMFLLMGGLLSLVVGLVGVLNFFNAVLTGILTRRREFAVLQAVGMTGKQLQQMLVYEGLCYAGLSLAVSLVLSLLLCPAAGQVMNTMFWFFTYRFSLLPLACIAPFFLLLGALIPLVTHRFTRQESIVERIRADD